MRRGGRENWGRIVLDYGARKKSWRSDSLHTYTHTEIQLKHYEERQKIRKREVHASVLGSEGNSC